MCRTAVVDRKSITLPCKRRHGAAWFVTIAVCAALLSLAWGLAPAPGAPQADDDGSLRADLQSYCGIQCLYQALRALGREIPFETLVNTKYVSSTKGSTVADLEEAAKDLGLYVQPLSRMTCAMLKQIQAPVILHVKSELQAKEYNHWMLFMGTDGGKAKVYNGDQPAATLGFDEIDARWDGTGLLVSEAPVNTAGLWVAALAPYVLYAGVIAFVIGLLSLLEQRWKNAGDSRRRAVLRCVAQGAGLFFIIVAAGAAYRFASDQGFLSSPAAVAAVQDNHFENFVPKVKTDEIARLLGGSDVVVVDARVPGDYNAGHLKGAINIPVDTPAKEVARSLVHVPKTSRIIVYSHSSGCPYGGRVAREVLELGYHNVAIFKGGWIEWEKRHPPAGRPEQLVQGG
jgi:rhodanese-related sulfurtransferase